MKLNKVDSYFIKEYAADAKRGIQHPVTIIAKLSDPDALGEERIAFKDCLFDSFDLANWKVGSIGDESYDFTFSDYEVLDTI